jgi:hypothetical protein
MLKGIIKEIKDKKENKMNFNYKLVQNEKTNTLHIVKAPILHNSINYNAIELIYKHNKEKVNSIDLRDFNFYIQELNFYTYNNWMDINTIRLASAIIANSKHNVCANCVKELYINQYPDMD